MPDTPKRLGFFSRILDDAPPAERYALALEQIQQAERFGLHSAWVAQHHFDGQEGGLPAPLVFLAHAAAHTSAIRLGTGIITLPLEDPVRAAEDVSVLDQLTGGRIELGIGSGGTPSSFAPFGHDSAERGAIYGRHIARFKAALAGDDLGNGNVLYPPARQLLDRVWQATFSVEGGQRAGAAGDGLMLSRTQPRPKDRPEASLPDLQHPIIDAYLEALPDGARPRILSSRSLFVADDRKTALDLAERGLRPSVERFKANGHVIEGDRVEDLVKAFDSHVGTPEDVVESLAADTTLQRATDITFQVHSIDPPHIYILRSIELLATEVAPRLGWAPPATPSERLAAAG